MRCTGNRIRNPVHSFPVPSIYSRARMTSFVKKKCICRETIVADDLTAPEPPAPFVAIEPELRQQMRDAFSLSPFVSGWRIEQLLGAGGLSPNYPHFDRTRHLGAGLLEFASIKSRDLTAKRYKSLTSFIRVTKRDIDTVASVARIAQWRYSAKKLSLIPFDDTLVARRVLEVVIFCDSDRGDLTEVVEGLRRYASHRSVTLRIFAV